MNFKRILHTIGVVAHKTLLVITILVLGTLMLSFLIIQIPSVQNKICKNVTESLSEQLHGTISLEKIYFAPFNRLIVRNFLIIEPNGDTLVRVDELNIRLDLLKMAENRLVARKVALNGGEFNLRHITPDSTNLQILTSGMAKKERSDTTFIDHFKTLELEQLRIRDFDFSMLNRFDEKKERGKRDIDWKNLELNDINLYIKDINFSNDTLGLRIDNLSFNESRGLKVNTFNGDVTISEGRIDIDGLHYEDGFSDLRAGWLTFTFDDFSAFNDFVNRVEMNADFDDTFLDFTTLQSYGGKGLDKLGLQLRIDGNVLGTVSNLKSEGLRVTSASGQTGLDLSFALDGLPDFGNADIQISIRRLTTKTSDLSELIASASPGFNRSSLMNIARGRQMEFTGSLTGTTDSFDISGKLTGDNMGEINFKIDGLGSKNGMNSKAVLNAEEFNLGLLLGNGKLGLLTCSLNTDAHFSKQVKDSRLDLKSFNIDRLDFNDYEYKDIIAVGELDKNGFDGRILSKDPNLNFMFQGKVGNSKESENSIYKFNLVLGHADLHALNFDKRDVANVRLQAVADLTYTKEKTLLGSATIKGLTCELEDGEHEVSDINLRSYFSDSRILMSLRSSLATINYSGTENIGNMIADLKRLSVGRHLNHRFASKKGSAENIDNEYRLNLVTGDLSPVFSFFAPGLYVKPGSTAKLNISKSGTVEFDCSSDLVGLKDNYFKEVVFNAGNWNDRLEAVLNINRITAGTLEINKSKLSTSIRTNTVELKYSFRNSNDSTKVTDANASFNASIYMPPEDSASTLLYAHIKPSKMALHDRVWRLNDSKIEYAPGRIDIDGFKLYSGNQYLKADGTLSKELTDTVNVDLSKFDISILNLFMKKGLSAKGTISGTAGSYAALGKEIGLLADLECRNIEFAGEKIGDIDINSHLISGSDAIGISLLNMKDGKKPLEVKGTYSTGEKSLAMKATLDDFGIGFAAPFTEGIVNGLKGSVTGDFDISGKLDRLTVVSNAANVNNATFTVDYTKVPYTLDGRISMNEKGIKFRRMSLTDQSGSKGVVSGGLDFDHFKNMKLDLRISLNNMLGINNSIIDSPSFYGKIFASGNVKIHGPFNKLVIDINATTEENSIAHIPLNSSSSTKASRLTFINNKTTSIDALDSLMNIKKRNAKKKSSLGVNINVNATPGAELDIEINKDMGDVIRARGDGNVNIKIGEELFDIKGRYTIAEGKYNLSLLGISAKDFLINEGGTIDFNGDIMQSDLGLSASYKTKASIGTLIADTSSVGSRRTVNCIIDIGGKLSNPSLKFNVEIPDLDPNTLSKTQNALSTEEKRMKQVVSLLLSGSFLPDEQSGIVNNSTILYSNASEIVANQVNNIFRQLDIPLDFGFNFQPDQYGRSAFDVALSTQLFNNRVTINGNLGNRRNMTDDNESSIVGDIDVSVKITKKGNVKFNIFSHSADKYSNYLDQTQRNGLGFEYTTEFDSFKTLWRRIILGSKKLEEEERKKAAEEYRQMRRMEHIKDSTLKKRSLQFVR